MKNRIFGMVMIACAMQNLTAQNLDCNVVAKQSKLEMKGKSPFHNYKNTYQTLQKCTQQGHALATNYFGVLHLQGFGVPQDVKKGFEYVQTAALLGNPEAQYNLGRLYKAGLGCTLNLKTALEWYTKSAEQGNQKAIYALGYMSYKGLAVEQDYSKAVAWFEKSNYQMAKQFLAICYYFGYGVTPNTEKAIQLLKENDILNSSTFLEHIAIQKKEEEENKVVNELSSYTHKDSSVAEEAVDEVYQHNTSKEALNHEDLTGVWIGKFIEFDESGKHITRVLPIAMDFQVNAQQELMTTVTLENQTVEQTSYFEFNNLFVDQLNFNINKQYTQHPQLTNIDYTLLDMEVHKTSIDDVPYLFMDVNAYFDVLKEESHPISIALRPKTIADDFTASLEDDFLISLANQEDDYIKLYPVPFEQQLHISFSLTKESTLSLNITNIKTAESITLVNQRTLAEGTQEFHLNAEDLSAGIYVVKVMTPDFVESKIVIKK